MHMQKKKKKMHVFYVLTCSTKLIIELLSENKWLYCVSTTSKLIAETGSPSRCGGGGVWYLFWITLRSCSQVFLSDIAHAQTSETCGGCTDIQNEIQMSVPTLRRRLRLWPHSTIHKLHSSHVQIWSHPSSRVQTGKADFTNMLKDKKRLYFLGIWQSVLEKEKN